MVSITTTADAKLRAGSPLTQADNWYLLLLAGMAIPLTVVMTTPIAPIPGFHLSNILLSVPFIALLSDRRFWRTTDWLERNAIIAFSVYIALFAIDFWRSVPNLGSFHQMFPTFFKKDVFSYFLYELMFPVMGATTFVYALKRMRRESDIDRMFSAIGTGIFVLSIVFLFACLTHPAQINTPDRAGMVKLCEDFLGMHYNDVGTIYVITVPILLYMSLKRGAFWSLTFGLALISIFLLESRTSLAVFMLTGALTAVMMGRTALLLKAIPLVGLGAVYILGKLFYTLLAAGFNGPNGINIHELLAGREDLIWAPLLFEWITVKNKFFWGAGLHGMLTSRLLRMGLVPAVAEAHDMYIEFLLDYGIYMLLLLLVTLAAGFRWAFRLGRRIHSELYWVLFLVPVAFFVSALTGRHFFPNYENLMMFPILGAMINVARLNFYPPKPDVESSGGKNSPGGAPAKPDTESREYDSNCRRSNPSEQMSRGRKMEGIKSVISAANWRNVDKIIASQILSVRKNDEVLNILEAGCGQRWNVDIEKSSFRLTGIDLDADALQLRTQVVKDLDEAIVGDLQTVKLEERSYDVIYNSYVLEHVSEARTVLENFATWLKPKGLLVIKIPDSRSVFGFVARMTPHWFHVFYFRYVIRYPNAGKPGYAPYPVFYDPVVSRAGIRHFCAENGLVLAAEYGISRYESDGQVFRRKLMAAITRILSVLSLGALSADHDGLLFFIRKA